MRILSMGLRGFRNLGELHLEPNPRFNVLVGPNAQGKTNVIEAIHALAQLKSFRATQHMEMVAHGRAEAMLAADIERLGVERQVRVSLAERCRRVWVNNQPFRKLSDYLGLFQAVLFGPEDVFLLRGTPAERRRWLDKAVFNSRAGYLEDLNAFNEIVKNRNAILDEFSPGKQEVLETFDTQLCERGARVLEARIRYLRELMPHFKDAFGSIFGESCSVSMDYVASWTPDLGLLSAESHASAADIQDFLAKVLRDNRRAEVRRGKCLFGPHRDDVVVMLDNQGAKAVASQGQHRAMVLALKISEINLLNEKFGVEPLLLLDDVSSELDREKNSQLFDFLRKFSGQVFITTTDRAHIRLEDSLSVWAVKDGHLERIEG